MNKIALLFPGQGAQYPGMGKPLYETEREIFDMAEKFRPGIREKQSAAPCDTQARHFS